MNELIQKIAIEIMSQTLKVKILREMSLFKNPSYSAPTIGNRLPKGTEVEKLGPSKYFSSHNTTFYKVKVKDTIGWMPDYLWTNNEKILP